MNQAFFVRDRVNYAGWIASTGQTSAHEPQSVQTSESIL